MQVVFEYYETAKKWVFTQIEGSNETKDSFTESTNEKIDQIHGTLVETIASTDNTANDYLV